MAVSALIQARLDKIDAMLERAEWLLELAPAS